MDDDWSKFMKSTKIIWINKPLDNKLFEYHKKCAYKQDYSDYLGNIMI